jgi:NTP pyrophosphatase (non-canonical NTP hydrolase)
VADRQWQVFHTPKNLATSICIEAAELAEHFQWLTAEQSLTATKDLANDHPIAQELADVLAYVLAMANSTGIDLSEALRSKMKQNAWKYPIPNLSETSLVERDDESNVPNMDGG